MKYWKNFFYFLCILNAQNLIESETTSTNNDSSEDICLCDNIRLETQLELLNFQTRINQETQLKQQKELFSKINDLSLETKFNYEMQLHQQKELLSKISDLIKGIEAKLLERHENEQKVQLVPPPVNDKNSAITEIRERLKAHDTILAKILNNQNDIQHHTQMLKNTISDKLVALENIDTKITNMESNFMLKNIAFEIISNQNNIQNLLNEMILKNHTQTLKAAISEKSEMMQKVDEKLATIAKNDQLKLDQDLQQYSNATDIYHKSVDPTSFPFSNNQSYPAYCTENKHLVKSHIYGPEPFLLPCREDCVIWTIIQRRINGSVDFYRDWSEYKSGFGNLEGEFFIGLDKLHALTSSNSQPFELLIQLEDFHNTMKYAKYDDFLVGSEKQNYKLIKVGSYSGNAGDSFSYHVDSEFSTKDRDNDRSNVNCAVRKTGGWWYKSCYQSNLNGKYYQDPADVSSSENGIAWHDFHGYKYSLKFVQMLIRPRKL